MERIKIRISDYLGIKMIEALQDHISRLKTYTVEKEEKLFKCSLSTEKKLLHYIDYYKKTIDEDLTIISILNQKINYDYEWLLCEHSKYRTFLLECPHSTLHTCSEYYKFKMCSLGKKDIESMLLHDIFERLYKGDKFK